MRKLRVLYRFFFLRKITHAQSKGNKLKTIKAAALLMIKFIYYKLHSVLLVLGGKVR